MTEFFKNEYLEYKGTIEAYLPDCLGRACSTGEEELFEAASYSLMAGGKRIRPVLTLAVARLLNVDRGLVLPFAAALEMIHTYSLIHDDLPAMDNDDLRRGRPTCHRRFGEALAILAGDFLLNRASEIVLAAVDPGRPASLAAARMLMTASGSQGMIGGQVLDLSSEHKPQTLNELKMMHRKKTGALISASVDMPMLFGTQDAKTSEKLHRFGQTIGLAFQIRDDILDVTAGAEDLGKTPAKDLRDNKTTFVSLLGLEQAKEQLEQAGRTARDLLGQLAGQYDASFLLNLSEFLLERQF